MDGWQSLIDTLGKFIGNVGVPVAILALAALGLYRGAPWAGALVTRMVDAFTTFLNRLNTAHEDMAKAVSKLADNTEHVPEIKATLARVESKVDGIVKS